MVFPSRIDWHPCFELEAVSVKDYEDQKPKTRTARELIIPPSTRHKMLHQEGGCTMKEMHQALQNVKLIQEQRHKTASKSKVEALRKKILPNKKLSSKQRLFFSNKSILKKSGVTPVSSEEETRKDELLPYKERGFSLNDDISVSYKHGVKVL